MYVTSSSMSTSSLVSCFVACLLLFLFLMLSFVSFTLFDKETCCKNTSVIQTVLRSKFDINRIWTILLCSSVTKSKKEIERYFKIFDAGTCIKGWIQSTISPSLRNKFAITAENAAPQSKSILCFYIKPYLGLELWTVWEKPCRPKRKRKLRRKPLRKRD